MDSDNVIISPEASESVNLPVEEDVPRIKKKEKNSGPEPKTTSWEAYTICLRKLVDQLIDLGASEEIKIVAFQLWASYLQVSKEAFISKNEEKLPALSLAFRNKDVKALYGIGNLRKKLFTRKRKRSNSDLLEGEFEDIEIQVEQEERELDDSSNVDGPSQFEIKKKIKFKSSAHEQLKEISGQMTETSAYSVRRKMKPKVRSRIKRMLYDRRLYNESVKSTSSAVTIVTLITIIRVALQIVGDEIYLSDILRWICEGRISFKQSHKKMLSYNLNIRNDLLNMKWIGFMLDIRNFTHKLDLKHLPTPNLFHLAERFCEELNLPNEILQIVLKLMVLSNITMDYSKYDFKSFPDYECRVMAFIIFALKLTLSLDDVTEHHLSEFADFVNELRSSGDDSTAEIPKLFSWRKWLRFVECRKAVLSMHHVPTNDMSYNNGISNPNIFLDNWFKVNSPYQVTDRHIEPHILLGFKKRCRFLSRKNVTNEEESIHYPVSFTPFKTYSEHLIVNHRKLLRRRSRKILSEDFSADSVNMAGNSQWYSDISEKLGIEIKVRDPARYFDIEHCNLKNPSLLAVTKTRVPRADIPVAVLIEDDELSEMISNEKLIAYQPEICTAEFDSGRRSSIKVFRSLRYWCFHEYHKKITVEEFEQLAINNFPRSFLWLLRECASMLRTSVKELYFELIIVEVMMSRLFPEKFQKKISLKINENLW